MFYMNWFKKIRKKLKLKVKTAKLGYTAHSKNLKIGENIAYEMLKRSIKRIFGFFEIFARNKKLSFLAK